MADRNLIPNRAVAVFHPDKKVVIELVLAFVFVMLVMQIYSDLQEPELTNRVVMSETGEMVLEENIPNSKYVR